MKRSFCHDDFVSSAKYRRLDCGSSSSSNVSSVDSLLELCSKVVAEHLPFEYVEQTLVNVPDLVQERIIYYSFPRCDSDIYTYASYRPKAEKCRDKIPYYEGMELFQNGSVENVIQIGFHLTGCVKRPNEGNSEIDASRYEVSITFDRCKIISACCDCGSKGLSWCPHVVALALYRIRQPHLVDYRSPISDALVRMDRGQLQKFAQYLIASHPNKVLPSAQQLADQLLQPESNINRMSGAPDPTAGASVEDVAAWYLDEAGVREQLRTELASLASNSSSLVAHGLFAGQRSAERLSSTTGVNVSDHSTNRRNRSLESGRNDNTANRDECTNDSGNRSPLTGLGLRWLCRYRQFIVNQSFFTSSADNSYNMLSELNVSNRCSHDGTREHSSEWFSRHSLNNLLPELEPFRPGSYNHSPGPGTHIAAMFAKVRELLTKRDSNGPRLLSLITEELLRHPKFPLSKSRRNRNGELPSRMSLPNLNRPHPTLNHEAPSAFSLSPPSNQQMPSWTSRLWDEICHLWTCVVLNPEFSAETRQSWRLRFLAWIHAHRCPRDEAYSVPSHYFSSVHDPSELEDEVYPPGGNSNQQNNHRSPRRPTVFQLPLEASFLSWDSDWLQHLLGFSISKRNKAMTDNTPIEPHPRGNVNFSVDLDDPPSDGSRRSPVATSRNSPSTGQSSSCQCPYCDFDTPIAEAFPVLCLRIAALRANGYFSHALKLAVFVSQRLERSFKLKVDQVVRSLGHLASSPHSTNLASHLVDSPLRRSGNGGSTPRCNTPYYTGSRYIPIGNPLSSPSPLPHMKYAGHGSGNSIPSPRPCSLSPPISMPSRPVSRRQVLSPANGAGPSPAPVNQPARINHSFPPLSVVPKATVFQFTSPPPTYPPPLPGYLNSSSFSSPSHPIRHPSSSAHFFRSPPNQFSPQPVLPFGPVRSTPFTSKVSARPAPCHSALRSPGPVGVVSGASGDISSDLFALFSGASSTSCASHMESGWLGLPGRPVLCLIECLLDAAAMAVESEYRGASEANAVHRLGQLESPAFYLGLSIKISILALFQQRCLPGSTTRVCASQMQETRLLALLSTMPKDASMLNAFCEPLLYLLGPPYLPPKSPMVIRASSDQNYTSVWSPATWSWSALGPLIHSDSNPVHTAARFVLDYILDAQKQTQLTQLNNCWTSTGGHVSTIRIEELLFVVIARSMRFSVLESVSDHPMLPRHPPNTEPAASVLRIARPPDGIHYPNELIRHLEVNTNFIEHPGFLADRSAEPLMVVGDRDPYGSLHRFNHPPVHYPPRPARSVPPSLDVERPVIPTAAMLHYPPLPSALFNSVQVYFRSAESASYTSSVPSLFVPPPHLVHRPPRTSIGQQHPPDPPPLGVYQQNPNLRRYLEALEFQQTMLAVSMTRFSKSHLHRLDQSVQICDRHVHSAVSLLTISQQIFAEAVGLDWGLISTQDIMAPFKVNFCHSFPDGLYPYCPTSVSASGSTPGCSNPTPLPRDRANLLCTAFHLSLLVIVRTLTRSVHWRRREMLAWAVCTALHVGPSACLHLITHWAAYVTPREAVNWLAPAILSVITKSEPHVDNKPSGDNPPESSSCTCHSTADPSVPCPDHTPLFGNDNQNNTNPILWPPWYGFPPPTFAPLRGMHANLIAMAIQLLGNAVPYSSTAREHIYAALRTMAIQAAAKDPVNCSLPALTLSERNAAAFDAVYRLLLQSAENGNLGPVQLYSLARYMDSRGWAWRAFPFALHATRLFVLSPMQDSHPLRAHVLWACSLAHRLGPGALHEMLAHVIRNIHCPTLLTEILHRCRISPCGSGGADDPIAPHHKTMDPIELNANGRSVFGGSQAYHTGNPNNVNSNGKFTLSLDRPPLKGLLDAAVNAYVTATHARLSNISPRQYAEFVDFLTRARDTFHLLRPEGPAQFRSLVECLRQTYRGKRKLVSLLADRFGACT